VIFGLYFVMALIWLFYFNRLIKTDTYKEKFIKQKTAQKVELRYMDALKTIKIEAFGIFLTFFLGFIAWPALLFSNSVRLIILVI
jgi:hypothetical protein